MSDRVLNFLEFSDKYSSGSNSADLGVTDLKNTSANFEEGFDDSTYDLPEIGANRPVSGNYETTPASPGESGAPKFSEESSDDMKSPELEDSEEFDNETAISDETANIDDSGEDDEDEQDDFEEDEDEEVEEGNPEAGANPKKKVEESFTLVMNFSQFLLENDYYEDEYLDDPSNGQYSDYDEEYDEEDEDICPECGETPLSNEYGYSCGCNM
jgi:hypothetical protein